MLQQNRHLQNLVKEEHVLVFYEAIIAFRYWHGKGVDSGGGAAGEPVAERAAGGGCGIRPELWVLAAYAVSPLWVHVQRNSAAVITGTTTPERPHGAGAHIAVAAGYGGGGEAADQGAAGEAGGDP